MLKIKFLRKELVSWSNIHRNKSNFFSFSISFFIVKHALLLPLKFYIIHALVLHWFH